MYVTITNPKLLWQRLVALGRLKGRRRTAMPILTNVRIEADKDGIEMSWSDMDMTGYNDAPGVTTTPGVVCVPLVQFRDLIRGLKNESELLIHTNGDKGRLIVEHSRGQASINTMDVDDYPKLGHDDHETRAEAVLFNGEVAALKRVALAVSPDDARPILTSIVFDYEEGHMRLWATDSFRLHVEDLPDVNVDVRKMHTGRGVDAKPEPQAVLFDGIRLAREIPRFTGPDPILMFSDTHLGVAGDDGYLVFREIEGTPPNYKQLIKRGFKKSLYGASADDWSDALAQMKALGEGTIPVRLEASKDGAFRMLLVRQDAGEVRFDMPSATVAGPKLDEQVAVHGDQLRDMLMCGGDHPTLQITDPLKPFLMEHENFLGLIMPVRL